MVSSILSFITGGAAMLIGILLSLLPSVNLSSLPILLPSQVTSVLGMVNVFIPFADLVTIITWWIALVLAYNVFMIVRSVVSSVTKK